MAEEQNNVTSGTAQAREAPGVMRRASEPTKPVAGTDTVTVACKLGPGVTFALFEMIDSWEPVLGGGQKPIKVASPLGISYTFRGPAKDIQAMRRGTPSENPLAGGYALTPGIPREHWEKIARDYRDHPAIANRLVFAASGEFDAMSEARNLHLVETGLEGIDPDNPGKRTGIRSITRAASPSAVAV
jgi:hypothetical protein